MGLAGLARHQCLETGTRRVNILARNALVDEHNGATNDSVPPLSLEAGTVAFGSAKQIHSKHEAARGRRSIFHNLHLLRFLRSHD